MAFEEKLSALKLQKEKLDLLKKSEAFASVSKRIRGTKGGNGLSDVVHTTGLMQGM